MTFPALRLLGAAATAALASVLVLAVLFRTCDGTSATFTIPFGLALSGAGASVLFALPKPSIPGFLANGTAASLAAGVVCGIELMNVQATTCEYSRAGWDAFLFGTLGGAFWSLVGVGLSGALMLLVTRASDGSSRRSRQGDIA